MTVAAVEAESPYVLIADADRHIAELATKFLPITVKTAWFADARAAFDAARTHPPLLIIAEVLSPHLDGLTFCRLTKHDDRLRQTKFLVLSVLAARQRALASGADAFLMKPIERTSFVATVEMLLPTSVTEGQQ